MTDNAEVKSRPIPWKTKRILYTKIPSNHRIQVVLMQ